jgi:hypothetical protein
MSKQNLGYRKCVIYNTWERLPQEMQIPSKGSDYARKNYKQEHNSLRKKKKASEPCFKTPSYTGPLSLVGQNT